MSINIMTAVWESSKAKGGALLVLLAIADNADDYGIAWPAVDTIAKKARMTERNVQKVIRTIVKLGELSVQKPGRHKSNTYHILLKRRPPKAKKYDRGEKFSPRKKFTPNQSRGEKRDKRGEPQFTPGVNPSSPESSLNHHIESPEREGAENAPASPTPLSVFQAAFGFLPKHQQQRTAIGQIVTDTAKWEYVLDQWALAGHEATNVKGQLDWYRNGVPQYERSDRPTRRSSGGKNRSGQFQHPPDEEYTGPRLKPYA